MCARMSTYICLSVCLQDKRKTLLYSIISNDCLDFQFSFLQFAAKRIGFFYFCALSNSREIYQERCNPPSMITPAKISSSKILFFELFSVVYSSFSSEVFNHSLRRFKITKKNLLNNFDKFYSLFNCCKKPIHY